MSAMARRKSSGYRTALGPSPIHRMSFEPLSSHSTATIITCKIMYIAHARPTRWMVSVHLRQHAVSATVPKTLQQNLQRHGYRSSIATGRPNGAGRHHRYAKDIVYFVEVKIPAQSSSRRRHRRDYPQNFPDGICRQTLASYHGDHDARLSVIEVTGETFAVSEFLSKTQKRQQQQHSVEH